MTSLKRSNLSRSPSKIPVRPSQAQEPVGLSPREQQVRETPVAMLRAHRGNVSKVAREMSPGRMRVRRWIKRFELDPDSFRGE
jgi:hypothetical protein